MKKIVINRSTNRCGTELLELFETISGRYFRWISNGSLLAFVQPYSVDYLRGEIKAIEIMPSNKIIIDNTFSVDFAKYKDNCLEEISFKEFLQSGIDLVKEIIDKKENGLALEFPMLIFLYTFVNNSIF